MSITHFKLSHLATVAKGILCPRHIVISRMHWRRRLLQIPRGQRSLSLSLSLIVGLTIILVFVTLVTLAKTVARWQWLIADEVATSMVSMATKPEVDVSSSAINSSICIEGKVVRDLQDNSSICEFLTWYKFQCGIETLRIRSNYSADRLGSSSGLPTCQCLPETLLDLLTISQSSLTTNDSKGSLLALNDVSEGGVWRPRDCIARQRVCVIVPFRSREEHLRVFLYHAHSLLRRQQLDYRIFVIAQAGRNPFNKASLMNVAYLEASSSNMIDSYDCFIFHDVDMLLEDDRNVYTCSGKGPRHIGSHVDKWNYTIYYPNMFGGVTAFTGPQFRQVNGYTNMFYGWGGEDDDMYNRIKAQHMTIVRYPEVVSRFTMLKHKRDELNPLNKLRLRGMSYRPTVYATDGLNTVAYKIVSKELRPLYTWIEVELPPGPRWYLRPKPAKTFLKAGVKITLER